MRKYVYEVPVIVPLENAGPGGYGFHAYLDSDLAVKARKEIMNDNTYNQFKEEGVEIVRSFFSKKYNGMPYHFAEDSWLIRAIVIPYGNACDLAFDERALEDFLGSRWKNKISTGEFDPLWVDYFPHNVDSMKQAMCLRELFIGWANTTNACLNSD